MKNNWNELKDIKAPQELKERTLAAAREARKLTNEPLHAVPRHPWGMAKRLLAAACAFGIVLGGTAVYRIHNGTAQTGSAELKGNGKTILNGSVIVLNRFQLRLQVGVIQVGSKPTAVHFFIHFGHHHFLTL